MTGRDGRIAAAALLAIACGAAACTGPAPYRPAPVDSASGEAEPRGASSATGTPPARAAGRPAPRAASGSVDVSLYRGAGPVTIQGGRSGTLTLEATDGGLRARGGRTLQSPLAVQPSEPRRGLSFGGRAYKGELVVRSRDAGVEVLNRVDLEDYVAGVLAAEVVLWSARPAELEAQAVAARSYAVAALTDRGASNRAPYLFADARDQAFTGDPALDPQLREYAGRIGSAVARTRGLVLTEGGRVVDARFHAACGGATADGRSVFPELEFGCMRPVACAPCAQAGMAETWKVTAPKRSLEAAAQSLDLGRRIRAIEPRRDAYGRWLAVEVRGDERTRVVPFVNLRGALGADTVKSSRIERTWPRAGAPIDGGLYLEGRGRGHGVGLCQTGAKGYAERGWSAERILAHYYTGASVIDRR